MAVSSLRVKEDQRLRFGGKSIEVIVGPEEETFCLHEELVRAHSKFFENAMSREWKESAERRVRLPVDSPDIFSLYQNWLYTRKIPTAIDKPGHKGNVEYIRLSQAYCLGEKLMDTAFKDAIIDAIILKAVTPASDGHTWSPVGEAVRFIYDGTPENSPARKLFVTMYVWCGSEDWITFWAKREDLPKDFLIDLTTALLSHRTRPKGIGPWIGSNTCQWHSHDKETICYKK